MSPINKAIPPAAAYIVSEPLLCLLPVSLLLQLHYERSVRSSRKLRTLCSCPAAIRYRLDCTSLAGGRQASTRHNTTPGGHDNDTTTGYRHVAVTMGLIVGGCQLMYLAVMICEAGCYSDVYQSGCFVTHGLAVVTRGLYFSVLGC